MLQDPAVAAVASALAAAVWLVVLALVALATRSRPPRAAAAVKGPGPEPPALAALLAGGWRLPQAAVPATLLDLAARSHLELVEHAAGLALRVRNADARGLEPYEHQVLEQVAALAGNGAVPVAALTVGPKERAAGWWQAFEQEVRTNGRRRGLSQPRASRRTKAWLRLAALVPAGLLFAALAAGGWLTGPDRLATAAAVLVPLAGFGGLAKTVQVLDGERATPAGREAAAAWLGLRDRLAADQAIAAGSPTALAGRGRQLAYAVALGVAPAAAAALAMGADDEGSAWSPVGGRWRRVTVDTGGLTWGESPWLVLGLSLVPLFGLLLLTMLASLAVDGTDATLFSALDARGWAQVGLLVGAGLYALPVWWSLRTATRAALDLTTPPRILQGQVVKVWTQQADRSEGAPVPDQHWVAVDDGSSDTIQALKISGEWYTQLDRGAVVRAAVTPNLGYVRRLDILQPPPTRQGPPAPRPLTATSLATSMLTGGQTLDPAVLVTAEDASRALGVPMRLQPPRQAPSADSAPIRTCVYQPAGGGAPTLGVTVAVGALGQLALIGVRLGSRQLTGLGDEAYIRGGTLGVQHGEVALGLKLRGRVPDREACLRRLATSALARLTAPTIAGPPDPP